MTVSSVEAVSKVTTNVFSDHSRSIIYIHKYNIVAPNRVRIDIVHKNKSGVEYTKDLAIFIVAYGVSGYQIDVETSVWDKVYEIVDNTPQKPITKRIHNLDIQRIEPVPFSVAI